MTARYRCSCCGFFTLPDPSPGSLEICSVCFWQDDMVGFTEPCTAVGPNKVSLQEARTNFERFGATERRLVAYAREALPEEFPPGGDAGPPAE